MIEASLKNYQLFVKKVAVNTLDFVQLEINLLKELASELETYANLCTDFYPQWYQIPHEGTKVFCKELTNLDYFIERLEYISNYGLYTVEYRVKIYLPLGYNNE